MGDHYLIFNSINSVGGREKYHGGRLVEKLYYIFLISTAASVFLESGKFSSRGFSWIKG